jgi:DNA-binding beta-propeller fold protein YncE
MTQFSMATTSVEIRYELVPEWEQLPNGFRHLDVADVAVDASDNVFVLARSDARVIVYDREGKFRYSWGENVLTDRPHGITIAAGLVYCADDRDHTVRIFTPEGEQKGLLGTSGVASDTGADRALPGIFERTASIVRTGPPFNRPTKAAIGAAGEIYVSDGYGNARIHKFSPDLELLLSWGEPGVGRGQFHVPHAVCVTPDQRVLVADRENDRIQVFTNEGQFLTEWAHVQRPAALATDSAGLIYVAENSWLVGDRSWTRGPIAADEPGRVTILQPDGTLVARLGVARDAWDPCAPAQFSAPHGIAVDSHGDLYVAEVTHTHLGGHRGLSDSCHTLQKFRRVNAD